MKNWTDPDDEIIRVRKKKTEPKPKAKKSDHKHQYTNNVCSRCGKEK